jgi:hypothetical protein
MKVTYIDPPMGWKFGFPKILPKGVEITNEWFVEQGYPQNVIDAHGKYFCWRTWEQEVEKVCCEGGPMTPGCFHDHCKGPKFVDVE